MTGPLQGKPTGEPASVTGKTVDEPASLPSGLPTALPTGKVTFLFTDIQGSTSMWERDATRMQQALVRHDEILRTIVTDHGGHVFKMVGDACYAVFSSVPEALRAAVAGQRAIFSEPWDERARVRIRMALHTGEAEERDGDYFGPPLNRVARLLSAGHGGQTLIFKATKELVEERLPEEVSLQDMGERRLKDLKEPERIFQLLAPDLPAEFPPLKTLETSSNEDRYRLIEKIGSGGMAEVYLAYDEFLQREVAFKVLDRKYAENKEAIERFRREARNAASLRHPNIVATHDRGETENGTYYIVMEYLEGGTLKDFIVEAGGPLPTREAAEIALEIADALTVAHENEVIHRDIKPQNILLSDTGEAKVADFGIARAASATTMTQEGSILGTVHYISPEQALGELATPKSDLYSLGVVLYKMLTGELPYEAESAVGVIMKHVSGLTRSAREANPLVPEELDNLVSRLLTKDPEERPADAATLAEELEQIAQSLPEVLGAEKVRSITTRSTGSSGSQTAVSGIRGGTKWGRIGTGGGVKMAPSRRVGRRLQLRGVIIAVVLVLASVGVIGTVALSQGGWPFAEPTTLPQKGALDPGRYTTDEFEPTFSFNIGGGWAVEAPETSDAISVVRSGTQGSPDPTALGLFKPEAVFDPNRSNDLTRAATAPESVKGWVEWIQKHPDLSTSEPSLVTVGGIQGTGITMTAEQNVNLWRFGQGGAGLTVGARRQVIVLNINGKIVLISILANSPEKLQKLLPRAQEMLDTVEWKAPQ